MKSTATGAYDQQFFDAHDEASYRSASIVAPLVMELVAPASVVDVGCGRGGWLKAFASLGVPRIKGYDGSYVDRDRLMIDPRAFEPTDLAKPFRVEGRYDLAMSLEVGEHLPDARARDFVQALTACADVVLFSAAVPEQGGTRHINEQPPQYWAALFGEAGFSMTDPIRRQVIDDQRVSFWYRQNMYIYANERALAALPRLREERERCAQNDFVFLYRDVYEQQLAAARQSALRRAGKALRRSLSELRGKLRESGG